MGCHVLEVWMAAAVLRFSGASRFIRSFTESSLFSLKVEGSIFGDYKVMLIVKDFQQYVHVSTMKVSCNSSTEGTTMHSLFYLQVYFFPPRNPITGTHCLLKKLSMEQRLCATDLSECLESVGEQNIVFCSMILVSLWRWA